VTADSAELVPRGSDLELDRLIGRLVDRATGSRGAENNLNALLHAFAAVSNELALAPALEKIALAARDLTGARLAAYSRVSAGASPRIVWSQPDDAAAASMLGQANTGDGPLAPVLTDRVVVRLVTPTPHGSRSLLGVPVVARGRLDGLLLAVDGRDPQGFSDEDAELLEALALAAGVAIGHAERYEESQVQHRWLHAFTTITQDLLAADGRDPLEGIAEAAFDLAAPELVFVSLLTEAGDEVVVEVARGQRGDLLVGRRWPLDGTVSGVAIREQRPMLLNDYQRDAEAPVALIEDVTTGPVMVVPLVGRERVWGVLSLVRTATQPVFTVGDLSMAAAFANHATVALELAEVHDARQRTRVLEDRDRIARDLHDHVIQQLFAIGLGLESTASDPGLPAALSTRLRERVDDLDRTIRRVRTSIFALRGTLDHASDEMRASIIDIASELTPALGFAPVVTFSGAPGALPTRLVDDVSAVVRESLSNVARHSQARTAAVDLTVTATELTITVVDDGVGIPDEVVASGTTNLETRAVRRGGSCSITPGVTAGTVLRWKVPLP